MTTASGDNRLYCFSLSCNDHRIPKLESIQKHCPSQWDAELGEECYKWTVQEDFTTELRRSVEKDIANLKMGKDLRPHMTPYASPRSHDAKGRKRARSPSESSSESESESEGTKAKKAKLQAKEQQAAEKKKQKEDAALKKKQEQEEAKKEREAARATRRDAAAAQRAEAAANKKATKQAELDNKKSEKQAMF